MSIFQKSTTSNGMSALPNDLMSQAECMNMVTRMHAFQLTPTPLSLPARGAANFLYEEEESRSPGGRGVANGCPQCISNDATAGSF